MTNSGKTRPNWNISRNCVWYDSNKFAKLLGMTSQSRASSPWFSGRFSSCLVTKLWWGNFCSNKYIKISNTLKHFSNVSVCGSVCEIRWYMLVGEAGTGVPTSSLDPFYNYSYVVYILDIDIDISTFRMHPYPYQQIYYGSDIYISDYEWVTTKDQCAKMSPKPFLSFTNVHISVTSSLGCMYA